jgi:hypothetical protein
VLIRLNCSSSLSTLVGKTDGSASSSLEDASTLTSEASEFLGCNLEAAGHRIFMCKLNHAVGVLSSSTVRHLTRTKADINNETTVMLVHKEVSKGLLLVGI